MDETQHSNYFQFFEWKDKDGNDTNIYARLRENKARPLLSKKEKDEKTGLGKRLVQKKLDKMVSGGIKIEARWFIKETVRGADGQIVKGDDGKPKKEGPFLDAKVNRTVMGLYYTHLRKATLDTLAKNKDKISGEQILKVNKALHKNPKLFWNKLKSFMDEKELDFLERKVRSEKDRIKAVKQMQKDAEFFCAETQKKCDQIVKSLRE